MTSDQQPAQQSQQLPLFYRNPVPIQPLRHAHLGLGLGNFTFAAQTNSVPVNLIELPSVHRDYPIVFSAASPAMPMAILGLRQNENLFVDVAGVWTADTYVPAYVRRYPFIFDEAPEGGRLTLCVDEAEGVLVADAAQALMPNGEPSEATNNALAFCTAFQRETQETRLFGQALEASGLLTEKRVDMTLPGSEPFALTGFRVVDEAAFAALDDQTFLEWRARGWLTGLYAHMLSTSSWQRLLGLVAVRLRAAGVVGDLLLP